jgi:gluconate 2-dehydrogenase gamma chain
MKRREFLTLPVQSLGGVLLYTLAGEPIRLQAQSKEIKVPLRFFTAAEARTVQSAAERIFPSDASGPGATEAGVVIYIDRQLAGPYGSDKYRFTKAPFVESVPEHGYQGKQTPREIYREGVRLLGSLNTDVSSFADLPPAMQDRTLRVIESSLAPVFFRLLRQHTIEGMFSDPMHGGNAGLIGWQLIGYPGPLMSYRDEIDKAHGQPWIRKPQSLSQIVGREVHGMEDEKD